MLRAGVALSFGMEIEELRKPPLFNEHSLLAPITDKQWILDGQQEFAAAKENRQPWEAASGLR